MPNETTPAKSAIDPFDEKPNSKSVNFHSKPLKRIGILGGIGAFASHLLLGEILHKISSRLHYPSDDDFPDVILRNLPVKGFGSDGRLTSHSLSQIIAALREFESIGCVAAAIACNSAFVEYDEILKSTNLEIFDLPSIISAKASDLGWNKAVVFCSRASSENRLHAESLSKFGISAAYPSDEIQDEIDAAIRRSVAGSPGYYDSHWMTRAIEAEISKSGSDGCVIGCTDLSVIGQSADYAIDSVSILADSIISFHESSNEST